MSETMDRRDQAEAGPSRVVVSNGAAPRKKKHPKAAPTSLVRKGTIPRPYLATAPKPISSLSQSTIDTLARPSSAAAGSGTAKQMLLPSSYVRSRTALGAPVPSRNPPSSSSLATAPTGMYRPATGMAVPRRKYAAGLAAPPIIVPGGKPNAPLELGGSTGAAQPRRRSAPRAGIGTDPTITVLETRRRSEGTLPGPSSSRPGTALHSHSHSHSYSHSQPQSLLGRIDETGTAAGGDATPAPSGRRRGEARRRQPISREDERALGLARSASMRRTNVWDDLPDVDDPPPAFPFPNAGGRRLPPTIEAVDEEDGVTEDARPPSIGAHGGGEGEAGGNRPRSPPPEYDVASAHPFGLPDPAPASGPDLADDAGPAVAANSASRSPSPTSTAFVSAPSSPVLSSVGGHLPEPAEQRADRRAWMEDLQAGLELDERVRRELDRRGLGLQVTEATEEDLPTASIESRAEEVPSATKQASEEDTVPAMATEGTDVRLVTEDEPREAVRQGDVNTTPTPHSFISAPPQEIEGEDQPAARTAHEPTSAVHAMSESKTVAAEVAGPPSAMMVSPPPARDMSDDQVLATPTPQRTLTRGKAIRRSSSDKVSPTLARRRSSQMSTIQQVAGPEVAQRPEEPQKSKSSPLFASRPFDPTPIHSLPTQEEDTAASAVHALASGGTVTKRTDRTTGTEKLQELAAAPVAPKTPPALPPHREAAMRRRHLTLRRQIAPPQPPQTKRVPDPDALIDFETEMVPEFSSLQAITTMPSLPEDLLELMEDKSILVAPAVVEIPTPVVTAETASSIAVPSMEAEASSSAQGSTVGSVSFRRSKAPPPPPVRVSTRVSTLASNESPNGLKRRVSILSTADTPILPNYRPSIRRSRHPPPPPPSRSRAVETEEQTDGTSASRMETEQPNDVSPPPSEGSAARYRLVDKPLARVPPPLPARPPPAAPRPILAVRPRGPRPPPPLPRSRAWSNLAGLDHIDEAPSVPLERVEEPVTPTPAGRSHSDSNMLGASLPGATSPLSPLRSSSAGDVRSMSAGSASARSGGAPNASPSPASNSPALASTQPRPPTQRQPSMEVTDLDVLLHQAEATGQTYEGYSQLTAFLGPAKPTAASAAELALLLPGPIEVDSRRVTAAGKTKLKMSLLGARVTKCPICLAQFKEGEKGVLMPDCGHAGHERCARRWLRENGECWVCRAKLGGGGAVQDTTDEGQIGSAMGGEGRRQEGTV